MSKLKTSTPPQELFIRFFHSMSALNPTHSEESVRFYQTTPLYADVYGYRFCPSADQFAWLADRWYALVKHPAQNSGNVASVTNVDDGLAGNNDSGATSQGKSGKKGNKGGSQPQSSSGQTSTGQLTDEVVALVNALLNQRNGNNNRGYNNKNANVAHTSSGNGNKSAPTNNTLSARPSGNSDGASLICRFHARFGKDAFSCEGLWCRYPVDQKIAFPFDTRQQPHPKTGAVWSRLPQGATQRSQDEQAAHKERVLQSRRNLTSKGANTHSANAITSVPAWPVNSPPTSLRGPNLCTIFSQDQYARFRRQAFCPMTLMQVLSLRTQSVSWPH